MTIPKDILELTKAVELVVRPMGANDLVFMLHHHALDIKRKMEEVKEADK